MDKETQYNELVDASALMKTAYKKIISVARESNNIYLKDAAIKLAESRMYIDSCVIPEYEKEIDN